MSSIYADEAEINMFVLASQYMDTKLALSFTMLSYSSCCSTRIIMPRQEKVMMIIIIIIVKNLPFSHE